MKKYFLNKMSTGKRLAKRSIVGTRVCAPGTDGIWYSGKIEFVKTANEQQQSKDASSATAASVIPGLTTPARYTVRFDNMKDLAAGELGLVREFRETELIGPGFRTIADVKLRPGQKVFLTYNGRENAGEVLTHDDLKDEVKVRIVVANAANGANGAAQEVSPKIEPPGATEEKLAPVELTKRLEEVRLLESRRSLRLAVQEKDTDFARLADMAGGDRRRQSNSIDVPFTLTQQNGSRKRRPSYSQDDREYYSINDDDPMDECNAALVLMSLSCSPNSGSSVHGYETILGTSSGSSTTSWSTGSTSPPLSEDGHSTPPTHHHHELSHHHHYHHSHHGRASHQGGGGGGGGANGGEVVRSARTTSLSTSDEGIGMEYNEDMPRKRRANQRIFKCTWKGCGVIYTTCSEITAHVRNAHLGPRKPNEYSDEEDFFFTETEDESDESAPNPPSPPTLSHRDMARPPHEDPEYQRQIVGNYRQGLLSQSQALQAQQQAAQQQQQQQHQTQQQQQVAAIKPPLPAGLTVAALSGTSNGTTNGGATSNGGGTNGSSSSSNGSSVSPLMHHNYITTWSQISPTSPQKHVRLSPRPPASYPYPSPNYQHHYQAQVAQQQQQQQQHHQQQLGHIQLSPGSGTGGSAGNGSTAAYQQLLAGAGAAGLSLGSYSGSGSGAAVTGSAVAAAAAAAGGPQHRSPVSPNRRTRGENKKCRKVYGMDHKDQWCTQCKWKKACSRFGD